MTERTFYSNIDRPILLFGVSPMAWLVIFCVFFLGVFVFHLGLVAPAAAIGLFAVMRVLQESAPPCYLTQMTHRLLGVSSVQGVAPSPTRVRRYGA